MVPKGLLPLRPPQTHKGDAGHVFIVAGSMGFSGAAALCAMGALRAGEANTADWDFIADRLVVTIQRLLVESYVADLYLARQEWLKRLKPPEGFHGDYATWARSRLEMAQGHLKTSLRRLAELLGFNDYQDLEPLTADDLRARILAAKASAVSH